MVTYPKDWNLVPLGECVTEKLSYGINAPAIPFNSKFPSYIRITDITDDGQYDDNDKKSVVTNQEDKYTVKSGDILLARTGASTGKSYLYDSKDGKLVYAGFLIKSSIDCERHNPRFIVGQLRTKRYWKWVAATSMRSGQPGINGKEYASFRIPVTTKQEEDAIAATLSTFDTHIDNLTALIDKKKAIRDGALADLMSERTRLAGFSGEWVEKRLSDVCKIYDGTHQTPKYVNSGIRFVSVENITNLYGSEKFISQSAYEKDFKAYPSKGDILMTRIGDIGTPSIVNSDEPLAYYVSLALFKEIQIDNRFLRYLIESSAFQKELDDRTLHHATPKKINKGEIGKCKILYPIDENEQIAIADILTSMDREIHNLEIERDKMTQIREGAMDDLLTGRVRLPM